MIHYTLLPLKEAQELKIEYRIRVFIVFMFFVSCSIIVGIIFLFPAYIRSSFQESESVGKLVQIQKNKEARGVDAVVKELKNSDDILSKLKAEDRSINLSTLIEKFVSARIPSATFNSIQISNVVDEQSDYEAIIQGKSATRESLLEFKKSLERNTLFSKIEFPVPDLTKGKDVPFAIKLKLKKIK